LWTLQCRRFPTGPEVAAARADRGENRDPGGRHEGSLDGGAAIRERSPYYKAADAWLVAARGEVQQGVHTPASASITVIRAGEDWIAQGETDGLERSTLRQYRQHLDYHIKPFIGAVRLAELTPAMIQDFRNTLIRAGRSRVMAKKAIGSLGAILATAMASGRVGRNVARDSERQNRLDKRHERRIEVGLDVPTKDEIRAMLATARGRKAGAARRYRRIASRQASTAGSDREFDAIFGRKCPQRAPQPPKAAFVTRLRPGRSPDKAARQLPDPADNYPDGIFLHWCSAPSGRTE
jgi:hypothetical protein